MDTKQLRQDALTLAGKLNSASTVGDFKECHAMAQQITEALHFHMNPHEKYGRLYRLQTTDGMMSPDSPQPFTLEQLSRALAAHAYLVARPNDALGFLAPEVFEQYADFIFRTAQGERVSRTIPKDQE